MSDFDHIFSSLGDGSNLEVFQSLLCNIKIRFIYTLNGRQGSSERRSGMLGLIHNLPYLSTPSFVLEGSRVTPCLMGFETFLTQQGVISTLP